MKNDNTNISEDAPANAVGGGAVAGMGVDKPGRPGSGEPGVKKTKYKQQNVVMTQIMKRKMPVSFSAFMERKKD